MVTARLTAAAVQAQIASQRQRIQVLESTLKTMESGMDKHMVQVQLKYAQGYLEALREQLATLQGNSPSTPYASPLSCSPEDSPRSSSAKPYLAPNQGSGDAAACAQGFGAPAVGGCTQGFGAGQLQDGPAMPAQAAADSAASSACAASLQDSSDSMETALQQLRVGDDDAAATYAACVTGAATAGGDAGATAAAAATGGVQEVGAGKPAAAAASEGSAAGNGAFSAGGASSLVDEDDWVCLPSLHEAGAHTGPAGARADPSASQQSAGWGGLFGWRKQHGDANARLQ